MDKKVININISKSFWESLPAELTININTLPAETKEEKKEEVPTKEEESEKAIKEMLDAITAIGRAASAGSTGGSMKHFLDLMSACGAQVNYVSAKPPFNG